MPYYGEEMGEDHVEGGHVFAAFGGDEVSVALAGLDEAEVHGADGRLPLRHHAFGGAAPLLSVAPEAADEADVGVGIHIEAEIEAFAEGLAGQDEDPLDHQAGARLDPPG